MADKEAENSTDGGPSLEMPSFGFGRKKAKRGKAAAQEPPQETVTSEALPREEAAAAEAAPVPPAPQPEAPGAAAPVEETQQLDPVDHAPEPEAPPLFADEAPTAAPAPEVEQDLAPEPPPEPKRKARRTPALGGMPAAIVTGAFIGLLLVGLTWGSLHLCELVRGTSACGKPGFLVLLAIMVILIVVGALLLKAWGIDDPGSTSFLGVGLIAVLLLLFLVELLFNWWMVIVVPILGMVSFALAYWLSTAFVEPD
jgi:hypothetical protein